MGFILDVAIGTGISPEREGEQGGVSGLTGGPEATLAHRCVPCCEGAQGARAVPSVPVSPCQSHLQVGLGYI